MPLLRKAAERFLARAAAALRAALRRVSRAEGSWWLEDYCLFMALKARCRGTWNNGWPRGLALREPAALQEARNELSASIDRECVIQFFFFTQWDELRAAAVKRGIRIIGDLPIFVAPDSADVWAHRELFHLDAEGRPTVVSGVPPDYFAATGQLWGNPLYDWDALARDGFRFWVDRIRAACRMFDLIRIDHFRGFESCWTVPAPAEHGRERAVGERCPARPCSRRWSASWASFPSSPRTSASSRPRSTRCGSASGFPACGSCSSPSTRRRRAHWTPDNSFLPHNHTHDSVVYTGTHDNDTTCGWYAGALGRRARVPRALRGDHGRGGPVAIHPARHGIGLPLRGGAPAGRARARERGAHEHPGHNGAGQLVVAGRPARPAHRPRGAAAWSCRDLRADGTFLITRKADGKNPGRVLYAPGDDRIRD